MPSHDDYGDENDPDGDGFDQRQQDRIDRMIVKPKAAPPKDLTKMTMSDWVRCTKVDFSNETYTLEFIDERTNSTLRLEAVQILKE